MKRFFITVRKGLQFNCEHVSGQDLVKRLTELEKDEWIIENIERV